RQELIGKGIFSKDYQILKEGSFVLLPVTDSWKNFEIVEREAEKRPEKYDRLKDALGKLLSPTELESLIGSFDIVGDIAIVEIPDELEQKERMIGEALLKVHKNLKTVLKKLGPMEGEFRVRSEEK